jgi:hydroxymethylbilane synthase
MQLLQQRPDLKVKDLRGNVNTRLRKLKEGEYDAIILAYIGLARLDLLKDIPYVQKLPLSMMIPPMGQAALGIEIVEGNSFLEEISSMLNDDNTYKCTVAERDFIAAIGAGCSAPVACNATMNNNQITLTTMIGYPDGSNIIKEELSVEIDSYTTLGKTMAKGMLSNGVKEILQKAESLAFKEERPNRL